MLSFFTYLHQLFCNIVSIYWLTAMSHREIVTVAWFNTKCYYRTLGYLVIWLVVNIFFKNNYVCIPLDLTYWYKDSSWLSGHLTPLYRFTFYHTLKVPTLNSLVWSRFISEQSYTFSEPVLKPQRCVGSSSPEKAWHTNKLLLQPPVLLLLWGNCVNGCVFTEPHRAPLQ